MANRRADLVFERFGTHLGRRDGPGEAKWGTARAREREQPESRNERHFENTPRNDAITLRA